MLLIATLPRRLRLSHFRLSYFNKALILLLWTISMTVRSETLLVWGDSLSAAYNIPVEQGWVTLLQQRLEQRDGNWRVANGSVSGETSAGGLTRLPEALARETPQLLIIGLGSNDGLQGKPLKLLKHNLNAMIDLAKAQGARVLLLGNMIPPNYGAPYANGFARVYQDISAEQGIPLVPFLLEGVATDFDLVQADGLHPTAAAQMRLLENVWPYLEPML